MEDFGFARSENRDFVGHFVGVDAIEDAVDFSGEEFFVAGFGKLFFLGLNGLVGFFGIFGAMFFLENISKVAGGVGDDTSESGAGGTEGGGFDEGLVVFD